jgi:hypothetical protein
MLDQRSELVDSIASEWRARLDSLQADSTPPARDSVIVRVPVVRNRVDSIIVATSADSAVAEALEQERAVTDSVIRADSALIAWQRVRLATQAALLEQARSLVDSLTNLRDDWRKESASRFGCTVGPGAFVSTAGEPRVGLGVSCGLRVF